MSSPSLVEARSLSLYGSDLHPEETDMGGKPRANLDQRHRRLPTPQSNFSPPGSDEVLEDTCDIGQRQEQGSSFKGTHGCRAPIRVSISNSDLGTLKRKRLEPTSRTGALPTGAFRIVDQSTSDNALSSETHLHESDSEGGDDTDDSATAASRVATEDEVDELISDSDDDNLGLLGTASVSGAKINRAVDKQAMDEVKTPQPRSSSTKKPAFLNRRIDRGSGNGFRVSLVPSAEQSSTAPRT
ncbi:hypothetical protein NMY22_g17092 [Coprinellus aureogranulatus]|nr:hypothetical protein NMY22_g17092 [Coprinellus aureogranulatus]